MQPEKTFPKTVDFKEVFPCEVHLVFVKDKKTARKFLTTIGFPEAPMIECSDVAMVRRRLTYAYWAHKDNKKFNLKFVHGWKRDSLAQDMRIFVLTDSPKGKFYHNFCDFHSVSSVEEESITFEKHQSLPTGTLALR